MWAQLFQKPRPRYYYFHLRQKTVPAGRLVVGVKLGLGEKDLPRNEVIRGLGEDGNDYILYNL